VDALRLAVAFLVMSGLLVVVEVTARTTHMRAEAARKLAHIGGGIAVASFLPWYLSLPTIALLSAIFIPGFLISRRLRLLPTIHTAERWTFGETYFPAGVMLAALIAGQTLAFIFGVLVLAISDGVAGLWGQRYGRHSYRLLGAHKTLEGSTAFLLVTWALAVITLLVALPGSVALVAVAFGISLVLTLAEAAFGWGLDNVVLPGAAAALFSVFTR